MEKEDNPIDALRELLEKGGYKQGEYKLTITKEIKIEPVTAYMTLETCLPYPISEKSGTCPICQQDYKSHKHMDYFIKPKHIKAVRNFLVFLTEKHDATKNMYLKLGVEAPDSVLTPKEMVLLLKDLAQTDVNLANQFPRLFFHYIPSESTKYETLVGVSRKLMEIETHYEGFSRKWRTDMLIHKTLTPTKPAEQLPEKAIVEKALGTDQQSEEEKFYKAFLGTHEKDAKIDYFNIQSDFHRVTSRILAYEKLAKKFTEMPRFGKLKRALRKRAETPRYMPPGYYAPPVRRRRPRT